MINTPFLPTLKPEEPILFYYREHLWSWFCRLSAAQCLCEDFPLLLSQHSHFCRCIEHLCHPVATLRESNKLIGAGRPGSSASAKLIPSQDASHDGHNFFEPIQFFTPFADGLPIFRGLQSPQRAGESIEFHRVKKGVIYGLHPILDGHHPA